MAPLPQPMPSSLFPPFHGSRSEEGQGPFAPGRWSEARKAASASFVSRELGTGRQVAPSLPSTSADQSSHPWRQQHGKKKAVHKTTTTDDKRLQRTLKRVGANTILCSEEVSIVKDDVVIQFQNSKVQASITSNTWVVTCQWNTTDKKKQT